MGEGFLLLRSKLFVRSGFMSLLHTFSGNRPHQYCISALGLQPLLLDWLSLLDVLTKYKLPLDLQVPPASDPHSQNPWTFFLLFIFDYSPDSWPLYYTCIMLTRSLNPEFTINPHVACPTRPTQQRAVSSWLSQRLALPVSCLSHWPSLPSLSQAAVLYSPRH